MTVIPVDASQVNPLAAMSDTDLAYLAGLIDGEGSITGSILPRARNSNYSGIVCTVAVTNTCHDVIVWAHMITRLGSVSQKWKRSEHHKDCWAWTMGGATAALVLKRILPYMKVRHRQAALLIEFQELRLKSGRERYNPARQYEIIHQIQDLNQGR